MSIFFVLIFSIAIALYGLWYVALTLEELAKSTKRISKALERLQDISERIETGRNENDK